MQSRSLSQSECVPAANVAHMRRLQIATVGRFKRPAIAHQRWPVPGAQGAPGGTINPLAGDPVALQDGRRLFNWYNCSGCHGGHAGGGMGPSLRDKTWLYGDRDDQIFDSIAEGRSNGMPAWGSKIPADQIWELVAYIKSMRTTRRTGATRSNRPTRRSRIHPTTRPGCRSHQH